MLRNLIPLAAVVAFLVAVPARVFAQDDGLDIRSRMALRMMKTRLNLTDEQEAKMAELLKTQKKEADEKIKVLLNDGQKVEYDKMQAEAARGGFGGGQGGFGGGRGEGGRGQGGEGRGGFGMGFGGPGGFDRGFQQILGDMKTRLNLSDGQYEKVQEIIGEIGEQMSTKVLEKLPEYMNEGRPDFRKMMNDMSKEVEKYIGDAETKIKKILKEEQIPEFEKMMGEFREQIKGMQGMAQRGEGRSDRGEFGRGGNRLERIMADITGSPEEKEIIREKVKAILEAEEKGSQAVRAVREELDAKMRGAAPASDVIQALLDKIRKHRAENEDELKRLREDLIPILSFEQEAKLIIHRVIE